jgi:hypothetical protein
LRPASGARGQRPATIIAGSVDAGAKAMRAAVWVVALGLLVGPPARAAELPQVTVTAPRAPTPAELAGNAVPNFVDSHVTASTVIGQLTRWRNGICPLTRGLDAAMNDFITARIRAVAAAVGAPVDASANCKYNITVLVTLEPQKVLELVLKQDSRLLGFHYPRQEQSFATFRHAVQGWYVTTTRNYKGVETLDEANPLGQYGDGLIAAGNNPMRAGKVAAGMPGSRLDNYRSSQVVAATIIVDANKIAGMTIGALSDYLAVLALTQARAVDACSQLPSIMDLLAAGCASAKKPEQVTAGDLAFLRALYRANLETPVNLEESNIQNAMLNEFSSAH